MHLLGYCKRMRVKHDIIKTHPWELTVTSAINTLIIETQQCHLTPNHAAFLLLKMYQEKEVLDSPGPLTN